MTAEAERIKGLMNQIMETLVPGEEYSINIVTLGDQYKFELNTKSKRAMVAWAEISFHLEECIERDQQSLDSF